MTTSVILRPRVTFGPSPPSSPPIDLTASVLSHSPIPFDTSLHPLSFSSSSSSSSFFPPSSSFHSATIPAVSGPLVSGSRDSPSVIFSSNTPLDSPPSTSPPSSPPFSQTSVHSRPIDASLGLCLPPLPVLRSSSNPVPFAKSTLDATLGPRRSTWSTSASITLRTFPSSLFRFLPSTQRLSAATAATVSALVRQVSPSTRPRTSHAGASFPLRRLLLSPAPQSSLLLFRRISLSL